MIGLVLLAALPTALLADDLPAVEVPASIGTCQCPDFFFVNIEACPDQVPEGYLPHCRFSAYRYLPDGIYHPSSMEELLASLRPGVPVCLLTHGAFVSTQLAAEKTPEHYSRILHAGGNRPLHFIAIHWPSEINLLPCPPVKLNQVARRADAVGLCLARLMAMIPADHPVCLLGHSLGARASAIALQALSRGMIADPVSPTTGYRRRIRMVFTAATIDHHWLNPGERLEHALDRAECLLNFKNLLDPALKAYPLTDPLLHHPLGQNGLSCFDRKKLGWQAEKITDRDVTLAVGAGHMIARYYGRPEVMGWMVPYVYFD